MVRAIYRLYLKGHSSGQIVEILTKNDIPTVLGKSKWSASTVLSILKNENYCGDALCQKTYTPDPLTHKSVKNNGKERQYFIEGHHPPIIGKSDWLLVQQIRKERIIEKKNKRFAIRVRKAAPPTLSSFQGPETSKSTPSRFHSPLRLI